MNEYETRKKEILDNTNHFVLFDNLLSAYEAFLLLENLLEKEDFIVRKKSKNRGLLNCFIKYCELNPEQRFWQALKNWSKWNYILKSTHYESAMFNHKYLSDNDVETQDTFYEETR